MIAWPQPWISHLFFTTAFLGVTHFFTDGLFWIRLCFTVNEFYIFICYVRVILVQDTYLHNIIVLQF